MRLLRIVQIALALISPLIFIKTFVWFDSWHSPPERYRISAVEVVMSESLTPPGPDAEWQARPLPLFVRDVARKNGLWYAIAPAELPADTSDDSEEEMWTLSVGAPFGSVAVYRNKELLAEIGKRQGLVSVYRWPVSIDISPRLLQRGDVLYVNFARPNSLGYVYNNYLGPKSELAAYQEHQYFLRLTLPQWIEVVMCAVGVLMLALFWLRPVDTEYAWWALMLFAWALREATDLAVDPWVESAPLWVAVRAFSLGGFAFFGYLFIKSFLRIDRSPFDPAIWVSGAIWTVILLVLTLMGTLTHELNDTFWTPWVVAVAVLCCLQLGRAALESPKSKNVWALLMVCWLISAVGFYDYKVAIDPNTIAGYVQYLRYSAGFALIVFTLILMRRFAGALGEVEDANTLLEERVEDQKQKLTLAFDLQKQAEQKQLVAEERERIMQDMHDGIGGQLVQALSIVSQDPQLAPVEPALRRALDDLRLIIDSLSVPDGNLTMLLASFRHRLTRPIERAGLEFKWALADLPDSAALNPSELLHVLRILQESVTNVLKHSRASVLSIATDVIDNAIRIRVVDNGEGFEASDLEGFGRGLPSMQKRASRIGATLSFGAAQEAPPRGTQVELLLLSALSPAAGDDES